MLNLLIVILVIAWLTGWSLGVGGLIHLLLVVLVVVVVIRLLRGEKI